MARPLRIEYAGAIYHVISRGIRGELIGAVRVVQRGAAFQN